LDFGETRVAEVEAGIV